MAACRVLWCSVRICIAGMQTLINFQTHRLCDLRLYACRHPLTEAIRDKPLAVLWVLFAAWTCVTGPVPVDM